MKRLLTLLLPLAVLLLAPQSAQAEAWEKFEAKQYGFSMLVPPKTKLAGSTLDNGWGVLVGENDGVKLYGCAVMGKSHSFNDIKAFGCKQTGIPADKWKAVDRGSRGKLVHFTVQSEADGKVVYGMYGASPRGSYLLVLVTTAEDFKTNRAAYQKWYDSIQIEDDWQMYRAEAYGFTMLIPSRAVVQDHEADGWGMLRAATARGEVKVSAVAKLGVQLSAEDLEEAGIEATGIAAKHWKHIDEGKNRRGWTWYKTVVAEKAGRMIVGGYGVGPKGSFLMLMETTKGDYDRNKAEYDLWYSGVYLSK